MREFKFFKGTKGTLNMMGDITRATASFNADTPEGHMNRRHLYNAQRDLYERLRNDGSERYYFDRDLQRFETVRNNNIEEVPIRINGGIVNGMSQEQMLRIRHRAFERQRERDGITHRDNHGNSNHIPFFIGTTRVTRVNPKWWMKIKIFFQEQFWFKDPTATIAIAFSLTTLVVLSLHKLLK